jgi:hypothetical protein
MPAPQSVLRLGVGGPGGMLGNGGVEVALERLMLTHAEVP